MGASRLWLPPTVAWFMAIVLYLLMFRPGGLDCRDARGVFMRPYMGRPVHWRARVVAAVALLVVLPALSDAAYGVRSK